MRFCDEKIQNHLLNGGKIKRRSRNFPMLLSDDGGFCYQCDYIHTYCLNRGDLTANDWEIIEPKYDWEKIIKDKVLCVFWDNDDCIKDDYYILGYLTDANDKRSLKYQRHSGDLYKYCKPFNSAEFKIAKDLKEYEK